MASPMQSCWVGSHIMKHLANLFQQECPEPAEKFRALVSSILKVRDVMWPSLRTQLVPTRSVSTMGDVFCIQWHFASTCVPVSCQPGLMVRHLLMAEVQLTGGDTADFIVHNAQGDLVDHDCSLFPGMVLFGSFRDQEMASENEVDLPGFDDEELACLRTGRVWISRWILRGPFQFTRHADLVMLIGCNPKVLPLVVPHMNLLRNWLFHLVSAM